MKTECLVCAAETKDVWLCTTHRSQLYAMLNRLPGLAHELETTTAKLDKVVRNIGGHQKNGAAPGIVNFDAAAVWTAMRDTLLRWVKRTATPETSVFPTVPAMVLRLRGILPAIVATQDAGFMYTELAEINRRATLAVDLPPTREGWDYAGPCGAVFDNGTCPNQLWVRHGETAVTCQRCGTGWEVGPRRSRALVAAANMLATADTISRALTTATGHQVTAANIYTWKSRGRLTPAGTNKAGQAVYRVGDVAKLAEGRE